MDKAKVRARFIHLLHALCPPHLFLRVTHFVDIKVRALISLRAISQLILMPCMFAESAWSGVCNHDKHAAKIQGAWKEENQVSIFSW